MKKPPHLKSWNGEEKENEISESERRHQFAVSPPRLSSLFTGKTPESFSHSFSQPSNVQNNLVAAASSQNPVQTTIEFRDQMQTKQNSGTISPQITFLASQGAHVPSGNTPQQTIGRMFTTEKSTMPQLVNYEANMKESDQENNRALWRWQYGINGNTNQNMEKNSISRSFGADDIVINFNDMNSEQYTKMIKQQLEPNMSENIEAPQQIENLPSKEKSHYNDYISNEGNNNQYSNDNMKSKISEVNEDNQYSTENITPLTHSADWYRNQYDSNKNYFESSNENSKQMQNENIQTSRPKLITQQQFIPLSQTVTQNYNYDEDNFESRRTKILNSDTSNYYDMNLNVVPLNYEKYHQFEPKINEIKNESKIPSTTEPPTTSTTKLTDFATENIKFTDFIVPHEKNDFKPVFRLTEVVPKDTTTTTTEASIENVFEENIFLKNMFRNNKNDHKLREENNNNINLQIKPLDTRIEKHPKFIQYQSKPQNEIKIAKKKPMDIADILNFISKNQFESSKLKSKPKHVPSNLKPKNEMHYYAPEEDDFTKEDSSNGNYRTLQQQEELRGVIKNYKVLHRNNNFAHIEQDNVDGLRRNLSPPPIKSVNLPPLGRAGPSMKSYLPPIYV